MGSVYNFRIMVMQLEEQFDKLIPIEFGGEMYEPLREGCIEIADNHAIRFNNWVQVNAYKYPTETTSEQLLKIYKKTL